MSLLEGFRFRRKRTPLHSLDPRVKFMIAIDYTILSLWFIEVIPLFMILLSTLVLVIIAKSLGEWKRTMKGILPFLLLIFGINFISIGEDRLNYSLSMTLRFASLTSAFSVFFLTTTPDELALAMESSGIPRDYSLMFTMALRFVPTLSRDLQIIMDALKSRGFELEKGNVVARLRNYAYILVPLIIYEIRRSLMIAEALEARGYGATRKVDSPYKLAMRRKDYTVLTLSTTMTILILTSKMVGALPPWIYLKLPEPL